MPRNQNSYFKLPLLDGVELLSAKNHTLSFPFHTHDTFNIALILNTTFNVQLSEKLIKAPVGTLSITNPDEVHATPCEEKAGNTFFTFYISPEVMKSLNQNREVFFAGRTVYDETLFQAFFQLSQEFQLGRADFEKRLVHCLRKLIKNHANTSPFPTQSLGLFKEFVEEIPDGGFSLEDTAQKFGMNKFKFLRLFKEETGLTPNHFMLLKRIERSKQLLTKGYPILDIALMTGFYDSSHFHRHFRRFAGVSPQQYQSA